MTTVYLVTDGYYSDYHVVGVYSTTELAERARALYAAESVEEYDLDDVPQAPPGMVGYKVQMDEAGNTYMAETVSAATVTKSTLGWDTSRHCAYAPYPEKKVTHCVSFYVWATDKKHAVKIANERRTRLIADGQWTTDEKAWRKLKAATEAAQAVEP